MLQCYWLQLKLWSSGQSWASLCVQHCWALSILTNQSWADHGAFITTCHNSKSKVVTFVKWPSAMVCSSLTPHRLWEIRGPHLAILLYVVQTENCFNSIAKNWNATRQQWRDGPFHLNIIHLYLGRVDTKHWHFKSGLPFLYRVPAISLCLHKSQRWPLRYFLFLFFPP